MHENFKNILEAENRSFFISKEKDFLEKIYPTFISYHESHTSSIKLTHQTLFLSSFTYKDVHYEDIKLPALFLPALKRILHYLETSNLEFDIEKLSFIEAFQPLFISNRLMPKSFGNSEHVFIVQEDAAQLLPSLRYIEEFAKWAKVLLFVPSSTTLSIESPLYYYDALEEIKDIYVDKFNFILILANYNELFILLENNKNKNNVSLF